MNGLDDAGNETLPHTLMRATRSVRYAATAALSLLALFLLVETISVIQASLNYNNPDADTITVTGEGTATAIPDTAMISFGATATAADVATAQANVTTIINNALTSVKANGVTSDDITTTSFNVSPHYTNVAVAAPCLPGMACPMNTNSVVSGYDVSEEVSVKISDTTKVAAILDGLAKANVTDVSGPQFVVGDTQAVEDQARDQAIQKAEADAQTLAAQLHVHLGKIQSYEDNSDDTGTQPMMANAAAMAPDASAPSVPVGQNTYTKDISITYEIH
jgi:uncharacterized protein YggE